MNNELERYFQAKLDESGIKMKFHNAKEHFTFKNEEEIDKNISNLNKYFDDYFDDELNK